MALNWCGAIGVRKDMFSGLVGEADEGPYDARCADDDNGVLKRIQAKFKSPDGSWRLLERRIRKRDWVVSSTKSAAGKRLTP